MNTALATQTNVDEQSLILPNKREALLMKLNAFKVNNLTASEQESYKTLTNKSTSLFVKLCWSKLGVSREQLKKLERQDVNELATIIYEQSKTTALLHTSILTCVPVIGWLALLITLNARCSDNICWRNMRYYWWYRRMNNKYGKDFEPDLNTVVHR